jgi:hypothetical protein
MGGNSSRYVGERYEDVKAKVIANDPLKEKSPTDPRFFESLNRVAELYSKKNHDYTKGGSRFGGFERPAKILSMYPNLDTSRPEVVAIIYMLKQLDAVLWGLNSSIDHKVEGFGPRLDDITTYSQLVKLILEDKS